PFGEQRKRLESRHAEWRRDPVEPEPRRPLEPRRLRRTPRPAAVDLVLVHDERQRLDVAVVDPVRDVRGGEWIRGVREEVQRVEARAAEALQTDPAAVDQTATVQGIDRALVYLLIEWALGRRLHRFKTRRLVASHLPFGLEHQDTGGGQGLRRLVRREHATGSEVRRVEP